MPKGLRNLPIAFEEPHLTHFAGMALIHAFVSGSGSIASSSRRYDPPRATGTTTPPRCWGH